MSCPSRELDRQNRSGGTKETQVFEIPVVVLKWSDWMSWNRLFADARVEGGITIPNKRPGAYEARLSSQVEGLMTGKAADLRYRIRQGLVKGKA